MPLVVVALVALTGASGAACASRPAARAATTPTSTLARSTPTPGPTAAPTTAEPSASGTASATRAGSPAGTPPRQAPTATPSATFTVEASPASVGRGETLLVRARGVTGGVVRSGTQTVPLLASPDGAWAVLGIGLYAPLGAGTVTVEARDAEGRPTGTASTPITVVDPQRPADYLEVDAATEAILSPESLAKEAAQRAQQFARFDSAPAWLTAFRHPVLQFEVSTQFGSGRSINGGPVGDFHTGEDLAADAGTPVTAAGPGRVAWVGAMPVRGNSVIVDHGGGVLTGYHHLLDIAVTVDQRVDAGALLGHVGSTGFSTGPHLHWELTIYGVNVDPETWTTRAFSPRP